MVKIKNKSLCWAVLICLLGLSQAPALIAAEDAAELAAKTPEYRLWVGGNSPARAEREAWVIQQALERTKAHYGPYRLVVSRESSLGSDWRHLLTAGEKVHIVPTSYMSFPPDELTLIPVPIAGGKLGYRHVVVRQDRLEEFADVEHANDLRKKMAGQGLYWPDMWVYEANGLPVKGGQDLPVLLRLLERGEIDYLPLGVDETAAILEKYAHNSNRFSIVPNLLIYYPLSSSPVVTNQRPELIARLNDGLEAMHADGSLHVSSATSFTPSQSRIIKLENPTSLFPVLY
ncbi:type 2 periplasmic-binding domain-containing protein [Gilvimarinus polysaccharolyticus]|uniref:hypothetical protein n=1 Tax=Gilvimarinus polysaccharolyticus TaxID=863921 RepID=UPI0006732106|nr:hypothetical protein [Gilvimarinus polysaccharolyticus]